MGVQAMKMLERLMDGESVEAEVLTLRAELIVRRSCGCSEGRNYVS